MNEIITINQLNPVKIFADKIREDYDIFSIKSDKEIYPSRTSVLSANHSDDPTLKQILSLNYSSDDEANFIYCLCKKHMLNNDLLMQALNKYDENLYGIQLLDAEGVSQIPLPNLLQLFFNHININQRLKGTGLLGHLYLFPTRYNLKEKDENGNISSNALSICEFHLNRDLSFNISNHYFTKVSKLKKMNTKYARLTRFAIKHGNIWKIKLVSNGWRENESPELYVQKAPIYNKKPKIIKFFAQSSKNPLDGFVRSKSGMMYYLIDEFNKQFSKYFSSLVPKQIEAEKESNILGRTQLANNLKAKVVKFVEGEKIEFKNQAPDADDCYEAIINFAHSIGLNFNKDNKSEYKFSLIHDPQYYQDNKVEDPHDADKEHIQHLVVEILNQQKSNNELKSILYTSGKELMIKRDLNEERLTLYQTDSKLTGLKFYFRTDSTFNTYCFTFLKNQKFKIEKISQINDPFFDLPNEEVKKIEMLIEDRNHIFYQIQQKSFCTLPNPIYMSDMQEYLQHTKVPFLSKEKIIEAIDNTLSNEIKKSMTEQVRNNYSDNITYQELNNLVQTHFKPKSSLKTKLGNYLNQHYGMVLNIDNRNEWGRQRYLSGLTDINFWKKGDKIFYNVGLIGNGMNQGMTRASIIRTISPVPLLNHRKVTIDSDLIFSLIEMMLVSFVKYSELTVLPFPEKYIKEYIRVQS